MQEVKRREDCKVVAFLSRDPKNRPFVKVCYDFGEGLHDPYDMDVVEEEEASNIYHHGATMLGTDNDRSFVKFNPVTGAIFSERDMNPTETPAFITGSEPGEQQCLDLIDFMAIGCSCKDVMVPFYLSTGKEFMLLNDPNLRIEEGTAGTLKHISEYDEFDEIWDKVKGLVSGTPEATIDNDGLDR